MRGSAKSLTWRAMMLADFTGAHCGECGQQLDDAKSITTLRRKAIEHVKKLHKDRVDLDAIGLPIYFQRTGVFRVDLKALREAA